MVEEAVRSSRLIQLSRDLSVGDEAARQFAIRLTIYDLRLGGQQFTRPGGIFFR